MGELAPLLLSQGVQAGASAANAYAQTNALRGQQQYASGMARVNYDWMELQRQDALRRGDLGVSRARLQGRQVDAALAVQQQGSGADPNFGSAAAVRSAQRLFADLEALDAQQSSYRQALGLRAEQSSLMGRDRMNRLATRNQIRNTLLQTGLGVGGDALRSYYLAQRYKGLGKKAEENGYDDELPYVPHP